MDVQKSQSVPLLHFSALCDLPETSKKIRKKFGNFFSQDLVFWELLLSPVVEKVVFVFESFWALVMAPTWALPGLFLNSVIIYVQNSYWALSQNFPTKIYHFMRLFLEKSNWVVNCGENFIFFRYTVLIKVLRNRSLLIYCFGIFEGYRSRTATTHTKRQLIWCDNSYDATTRINLKKATTYIERQCIPYSEIENTDQVLTDANLQSINSSLEERLS